jgi:transposase-like protein
MMTIRSRDGSNYSERTRKAASYVAFQQEIDSVINRARFLVIGFDVSTKMARNDTLSDAFMQKEIFITDLLRGMDNTDDSWKQEDAIWSLLREMVEYRQLRRKILSRRKF